MEVACDVTNVLTGEEGASAVYGPQKGATRAMVQQLDANLNHLATIIHRDLGIEVLEIPGGGAAGGLGAGLVAFAGATLRRGVEMVMDAVRLREVLRDADLCLTGEGRLDSQSAFGKTACGVGQLGRELGVPVLAIVGSTTPLGSVLDELGLTAVLDVTLTPCSLLEAIESSGANIEHIAEQAVRIFLAGRV